MVPDMCGAGLGWTLEQEEELNSAARLEEKIIIIIIT